MIMFLLGIGAAISFITSPNWREQLEKNVLIMSTKILVLFISVLKLWHIDT